MYSGDPWRSIGPTVESLDVLGGKGGGMSSSGMSCGGGKSRGGISGGVSSSGGVGSSGEGGSRRGACRVRSLRSLGEEACKGLGVNVSRVSTAESSVAPEINSWQLTKKYSKKNTKQ